MVRHVWSNLRASYAILERRTVVSGFMVLYRLSGIFGSGDHGCLTGAWLVCYPLPHDTGIAGSGLG